MLTVHARSPRPPPGDRVAAARPPVRGQSAAARRERPRDNNPEEKRTCELSEQRRCAWRRGARWRPTGGSATGTCLTATFPVCQPGSVGVLDGKVTGGSRGIGRAVVRRFAHDGAEIVFSYLSNDVAAKELEAAIEAAGGRVVTSFADASEEDFDRVVAVSAKGTFFAMQEAARRMRNGGRTVNISTVNTVLPSPGVGISAGTKAAVEQFAQVAARELAARGTTVNVVSPGATDTEMFHSSNPPGAAEQVASITPLGRLGQTARCG